MKKVLFVCLGNICRSPMAEFLFKDMIHKKGLDDMFYVESAGTSNEEYGNGVHYKVKKMLDKLGIDSSSKTARKINESDYDKFDYIIAMDKSNIYSINRIIDDYENKVYRLLDFSNNPRDIADPWYTGNFEESYKDIMEGLDSFLNYLGY